jgi:hypothetical protein
MSTEIIQDVKTLVVEVKPPTALVEIDKTQTLVIVDDKTLVIPQVLIETIVIENAGVQGPVSTVGELQFNAFVLPTENKTIDSVLIANTDSVIWEAVIVDRTTNRRINTTIRAVYDDGIAKSTEGPIFGAAQSVLPHNFEVIESLGRLVLQLENLHINPLTVQVLRLKTDKITF